MKKTTRLRQLIEGPGLSFLMEAHSGLSARIAEEAGFPGLWASGLSISACLGVRDANEASWTDVLQVVEFMCDATSVPILLDGDTGYGNFNNMRRLVRKLEQRNVAGVCIEDKLFPKTNSFIDGHRQPLAEVEEFCGKIRAGKDAQTDPDFVIVARCEAFIAGWGLAEALRRCDAYREAGADAILIHSALSSPREVLAFKEAWGNRLPVVIVPTKYYSTPTDVFREAGISVCIWANHQLRSSIRAMQETARALHAAQSLAGLEDSVVPVKEVFRLQRAAELAEAEQRYLPAVQHRTRAIVLAASQGSGLGDLTKERPKAMLDIAGKPLLERIIDGYRAVGVSQFAVVRGFGKQHVNLDHVSFYDNDRFDSTGEAWSLYQALPALEGHCVISYGDVLFRKHLPELLLSDEADLAVLVDPNWEESPNRRRVEDYVRCSHPHSRRTLNGDVVLRKLFVEPGESPVHGEWIGFLKTSPRGSVILRRHLEELAARKGALERMTLPQVMQGLIDAGHEIRVLYSTGHWLDVDTLDEVLLGSQFR